MKNIVMLLSICMVSEMAYSNDRPSNIFYIPYAKTFAGKTKYIDSNSKLDGELGGVNIVNEKDLSFIIQTLAYGITDWVTLAIELPFLISGKEKVTSGTTFTSGDLDEGLKKPAVSMLLRFEHQSGWSIYPSLSYKPKDSEIPGFVKFMGPIKANFNEQFALLFNGEVTVYSETDTTKSSTLVSVGGIAQYYFNDTFFGRLGLTISQQTATEYKNSGLEIHYLPSLSPSIEVGSDIIKDRFFWTAGYTFMQGRVEGFLASSTGDGDLRSNALNFQVGYLFN